MDEVHFYVVGYNGASGRITAECVQLGQISTGQNLEEAFDRCVITCRSMLHGAAGGKYEVVLSLGRAKLGKRRDKPHSPFIPSCEEVWDLIIPSTMKPIRENEYDIEGKYKAKFYCFDRTDVENPHNIT